MPPFPDNASYQITNDGVYTKDMDDLLSFKDSEIANRLTERISAISDRQNWKGRLKAHYEFTSGVPFTMQIDLLRIGEIFDDPGTVNTTAKIEFFRMMDKPINGQIYNNLLKAVNGSYVFEDIIIVQEPGTTQLMQIKFENFEHYQTMPDRQPITFLEQLPLITFKSRPCIIGEYYSFDYTCVTCPFGKSTIEPRGKDKRGESCGECLEFAVCDGPNTYP